MKKVFALLLSCALLILTACGQNAAAPEDTSTTAPQTTAAPTMPPDDGIFDYTTEDLPDGWIVQEESRTSDYLYATYGDAQDAPILTVSVYTYNDADGPGKAKALAAAVQKNEKETASDISEVTIGGTAFYMLHFKSRITDGKLRYEAYGQSEPGADKTFKFVIISLENITNDKHYNTLKNVFDCLEFGF